MSPAKNTKKPEAEEEKKAPTTEKEGAEKEASKTEGAETTEAPAAEAPKEPAKAPSNGKSILIVEDEKPLSHALEMKLKKGGYETKVVMNGQDALTELKAKKYDMILMDLIMPVMDGFELLTEMKKAGHSIPSIVLSNLGQEEDKKKAESLGAVDYCVKANTPISEIIDRVQKTLK